MGEDGFKVCRTRSQDNLVAVDLLVFDNEGDITEFSLIKDGDEVPLEVDVMVRFLDV